MNEKKFVLIAFKIPEIKMIFHFNCAYVVI